MTDLSGWTEAKLVKVYRKIRDVKDAEAAVWKAREKELDDELDTLSSELVERLKKSGQHGFSTEFGSVIKRVQTRIWPSDWDVFKEFALKHDGFDWMEKRIHQGNMAQFIKENPDVVVPVNIDSKLTVTVRKPTRKSD
jgi:hypothetical protein